MILRVLMPSIEEVFSNEVIFTLDLLVLFHMVAMGVGVYYITSDIYDALRKLFSKNRPVTAVVDQASLNAKIEELRQKEEEFNVVKRALTSEGKSGDRREIEEFYGSRKKNNWMELIKGSKLTHLIKFWLNILSGVPFTKQQGRNSVCDGNFQELDFSHLLFDLGDLAHAAKQINDTDLVFRLFLLTVLNLLKNETYLGKMTSD